MRGKALDVDLVDDELFEPMIWELCPMPVAGIVDDDPLGNDRRFVAAILHAFAASWLRIVGEQQVVGVAELPGHGLRVRVQEEFGIVESQSPLRTVLTANLVAI